jgi:predicted RNA-binding protein with PIN domain
MHIIIDGYNLIRRSDALRRIDKSSLEAGRRELIRRLTDYARGSGHGITVVFDGWMSGSPLEERGYEGGIRIIYSKRGEKADEVIKRMVQKGGQETIVVTSDRAIVDFVSRAGTAAVSADVFASKLRNAKPAQPFDCNEEVAENDGNEITLRGTRKKGPSRRLSRKKRLALTRIKKL